MKGYILILVLVILVTFLWKFMIIAGIIWYGIRKCTQYYFEHREEWLNGGHNDC